MSNRLVDKSNKSNQVVDSILSYIIENHLRPGDKLPSEEELTRRLGVSRVSVREGLRGLKFLGLLQSSTSRGTEIREMDFSILTRCLGFQIAVSDISFAQLLEARLTLETSAIELLCGHLTTAQLDDLEATADCSRRDNSPTEVAKDFHREREFHHALLRACGNQVLISFARLLEIFFSRSFPEIGIPESKAASLEHRQLVDALRRNNLDLARGIMKQHLNKYRK